MKIWTKIIGAYVSMERFFGCDLKYVDTVIKKKNKKKKKKKKKKNIWQDVFTAHADPLSKIQPKEKGTLLVQFLTIIL